MCDEIKLTYSSFNLYGKCPQAYKYRYVEGIGNLKKDTPANALRFGSIVHAGLERIWKGVEIDRVIAEVCEGFEVDQNDTSDKGIEDLKALACVRKYAATWQAVDAEKYTAVETEVPWELKNFKGQVDGVITDKSTGKRVLLEHKTAARVDDDYFAVKLQMDLQIRIYCKAMKCDKVLYDVIKKPMVRQRKDEAPESFIERYYEAVEFERREFDVSKPMIKEAEKEMNAVLKCIKKGDFTPCRSSCHDCEYLGLCTGAKDATNYETYICHSEVKNDGRNAN